MEDVKGTVSCSLDFSSNFGNQDGSESLELKIFGCPILIPISQLCPLKSFEATSSAGNHPIHSGADIVKNNRPTIAKGLPVPAF